MLGKIIKLLYGSAKYGELLIVVCFVSDAALILPSYLLVAYRVRDGVVCYMSINNTHKVTA
ncbi:hypothetical protein ANAPC1_00878 [Anaplasma phagocytophilum]|uniref:Uncharacterized protein n=1 Tax=Anaplasma phagocytophilum TaxID=948 RepID=A0AA45ZHQ3_ANAPH|nr:hypothetical protein ANAPC1_00878 [Anaplasma phagocytophilum]SBO31480.1 hypothetical protein ANAPC2_00671 [Anaplasma phagocytophilum]SBO31742.1 hypothetical protein ANAPC3_00627 [Anaplasma phagocytophilum]SBO32200.1 hypothetical protein ANAPC4_00731 [Anaplasma phagocytophilum]SBO32303.1 hypothetical protein ANAPC3_00819 [Anaplasma phagocytophilum]